MNAHIIAIGDELLIGQVINTNAAWLGEKLTEIGIHVAKMLVIPDEETAIVDQLEKSCAEASIVIVSGGLGPTKDDITKTAICRFLGSSMVFNEDVHQLILNYLKRQGREPNPLIREHCYFPKETVFLKNNMGTAPGMAYRYKDALIISVPGVPYEMRFIMENEGIELIKALDDGQIILSKTILTAGEFEARLAHRIQDITDAMPAHISIAFLPNINQVRLRLTVRGTDQASMEKELDEFVNRIEERLGDQVFGHGKESLPEVVGKLLLKNDLTMSTAESCTGGFLAHKITEIPGSSAYYCGSIISYSNEVKMNLLDVKKETLENFGAVSEQTVREMVAGLLEKTGTDIAVAVSGIAGPDGGTEEKPVGTIWLACGNREKTVAKKITLAKDRLKNIEGAAMHALDMLRHFILSEY